MLRRYDAADIFAVCCRFEHDVYYMPDAFDVDTIYAATPI